MKSIKPTVIGTALIFLLFVSAFPVSADDSPLPGVPRNLVLLNVTSETVRFGWEHPSSGINGIKYYNVYRDGNYLKNTVIPTTRCDVTHLIPGTTYTFKVSAVSETGEGPFSNEITVTTVSDSGSYGNAVASIIHPLQGQRLNALDKITGTASDSDGTVLKVALHITDSLGNYLRPDFSAFEYAGCPEEYYLTARNTGMNYSTWELEIESLSAFEDGEYTIRVYPYDRMYNYDCQETSFTLDTTPPHPPGVLSAEDISGTGLKLVWEPSASEDTKEYYVYMDNELYASISQTFAPITDLTPGTGYSFCITAHDGLNESQCGAVLQVSTPPASSKRRRTVKRDIQQYPVIRHEDGRIIVDTTNYFPGKQVSSISVLLDEELISRAVNARSDIIIATGFGSLCLNTSLWEEDMTDGQVRIGMETGIVSPVLLDFVATRPGFELVSDIFYFDYSGLPESVPVSAHVYLPQAGEWKDRKAGYLNAESRLLHCSYQGVEATSRGIAFQVDRPGIYGITAYSSPYYGFCGHWAEKELDSALACGILVPGDFVVLPDTAVTGRLFRSMLGKNTDTTEGLMDDCSDLPLTRAGLSQLAAEAVGLTANFDTLANMGIIIGYGDGGLYPERNATLAEAAVILYRLMESAFADTGPL
jgi:chitodextrinase